VAHVGPALHIGKANPISTWSSTHMTSNPVFAARRLTPLAAVFGDPHQALRAAATLCQHRQMHSPAVVCFPDDPEIGLKMQRKVVALDGTPWFPFPLATAVAGVAAVFLVAATVAVMHSAGGTPIAIMALCVFVICVATLVFMDPQASFGSEVEEDVRQALRDGHWAVVTHPRDRADRLAASRSLRRYGGEVL